MLILVFPYIIIMFSWEIFSALVFTPDSIGYLIGTNAFGNFALRVGR
jgi:hypothetical protein